MLARKAGSKLMLTCGSDTQLPITGYKTGSQRRVGADNLGGTVFLARVGPGISIEQS